MEVSAMPNVTMAIDAELLQEARAYAKRNGTTLNALVRQQLIQLIDTEARREEARLALIKLMETSTARLPKGWKLNRDEMYGGPFLPRHKHSSIRGSGKKRRA
jgi:hypothetical protein